MEKIIVYSSSFAKWYLFSKCTRYVQKIIKTKVLYNKREISKEWNIILLQNNLHSTQLFNWFFPLDEAFLKLHFWCSLKLCCITVLMSPKSTKSYLWDEFSNQETRKGLVSMNSAFTYYYWNWIQYFFFKTDIDSYRYCQFIIGAVHLYAYLHANFKL